MLAPTNGDDLGSQGLPSNQAESECEGETWPIVQTVFLSSGWSGEEGSSDYREGARGN